MKKLSLYKAEISTQSAFGLCVLLLGFVCLVPLSVTAQEKPPLKVIRTIVLDPGHGGAHNGTQSADGVLEKDQVLQVAYRIREELQRDYPSLKVVLTRNIDINLPLEERLHLAHIHNADLFFSLHMNAAANKEATGIEVFYLHPDKSMPDLPGGQGTWGQHFHPPAPDPLADAPGAEVSVLPHIFHDLEMGRAHRDSAEAAQILLNELRRACHTRQIRGVRQSNFGVLRGATVPSMVVEFGFLSNRAEKKWLVRPETHKRFAKAFSRAIARMDETYQKKNYTPHTGASE